MVPVFRGRICLFLTRHDHNALDMPLDQQLCVCVGGVVCINETHVSLASTYVSLENSIKQIWVTISIVLRQDKCNCWNSLLY